MDIKFPTIDTAPRMNKGYTTYGYTDHESILMMTPKRFTDWIRKNNEDARALAQKHKKE